MSTNSRCDECLHYVYDDEQGYYYCAANMDQDDAERLYSRRNWECPYYHYNDDYELSRKQ